MRPVLSEISQRLQLNELIDQQLQGIEELIIIPHLALHQIPFAALEINPPSPSTLEKESGKSPTVAGLKGQIPADRTRGIAELSTKPAPKPPQNTYYLSDRFRLRTVPSCQILNYCYQREQLSQTPHLGIVEDATENLPFTRYECDTLAQRYQVPDRHHLRGKQATLDNYKTLLQQIHRLHTSHHAASNLNDPLASTLQLSDRNLTLSQLLTWRVPQLAEVFASACETHFTATELTDDLLTIATGFLCTGVRNVISTQWSVEDLASALLAIFYYKNRDAGNSRSRALQQARQQLRTLTGEELKTHYSDNLKVHLEKLHQQAEARSLQSQSDRAKAEKWSKERDKIASQQQRLPRLCQEALPFASPYYWAGFISQGRA